MPIMDNNKDYNHIVIVDLSSPGATNMHRYVDLIVRNWLADERLRLFHNNETVALCAQGRRAYVLGQTFPGNFPIHRRPKRLITTYYSSAIPQDLFSCGVTVCLSIV
jgi:hypothetical protein